MKNLKIYWLAVVALVAGLFMACDDTDYTPGPKDEGAQVYFSSEVASQTFNVGDDENSVIIPMKRIESAEALTVAILSDVGDAQELFDIPASVTFAAGVDAVDLVVSFDRANLKDGTEYPVSLLINDENVTAYGRSKIDFTVVPWPWVKLGTGKFRDDYMTAMYGGTGEEIDVTIHKHKSREGIYMIEDMFGWNYLTSFFGGTKEQIEEKFFTYTPTNITINCADPNKVLFERQQTGLVDVDSSYGPYEIATVAYGTLADGIITFPVKGLALYSLKGGMYANTNGMFRIVLPGYEVTDYSLAAVYAGMQVGADNQNAKPVFDFTYGADVTGIGYTFVSGDVTAKPDEYVAGIVDGSDANAQEVKNFEVGAEKVSIAAELKPGIYTLVAVPKDKNGAYLASAATVCQFYFPGIGPAETHPCEVAVTLGKVSENQPSYAGQYPDYAAIYWKITGAEIKSVKRLFTLTENVENIKAGKIQAYADLQAYMDKNGQPLGADDIAEINEGGGTWNISINLDAATSYTMLVEGENIYGEKKLIESAPFTTDAIPYTGELKLGDYYMSYTDVYTDKESGEQKSDLYENVFTIKPTAGSDTKFFVGNFGIEAGMDWYADYDAAASTLTLSGVWKGNESSGSFLGGWVGISANQAIAVISSASEDSEGADPIVIKVDASTKQPVGLNTDVKVMIGSISGNNVSPLGYAGIYAADGTTIAPYVAASTSAAKSSVKPAAVRPVEVPFSSVRVPVQNRKAVAVRDNFASEKMAFVRDTRAADAGRRTLSVKTEKCESLPKQLTRKADFKIVPDARQLMK